MAFANETRTDSLALDISAGVHKLMQNIADYRAYRTTVRELSKLDSKTLADMGIYRAGIQAAAREAVYGY